MNLALLSGDRMDLGDLEQECNGCPDDVPLLRTSSCLWLQKEILCASIATRLSISQVFPDKMRKTAQTHYDSLLLSKILFEERLFSRKTWTLVLISTPWLRVAQMSC
jgi:hypothetical protein